MFTQDQMNAVTKSYSDEVVKLLETKANYTLAIQKLKTELAEKDKKIADLEKQIPKKNQRHKKLNGTAKTT